MINTGGAANGLIVRYGNVGIGTANPSQKLDVGSGNVYANNYWIGATGKWASQAVQCVQKSASGTTGQERTVSCDSGYTVTGGGCDCKEGGDHAERWYNGPSGNGWRCWCNHIAYAAYAICCK